ncbi:exported protein of unknown function [Streptantibioticus cattleyicolor NRRL 8057 = DSM 46488]|nr:exported protein of unknown function [Streptantibioticus cattleyicolor NRRL 8057 = DSM 46488]
MRTLSELKVERLAVVVGVVGFDPGAGSAPGAELKGVSP